MAVTLLQLTAALQWTLSKTNTGFATTAYGPDSITFTLQGVSLTAFTSVFIAQYSILAAGTQNVDLSSFTDFAGNAITPGHALALILTTSGGGGTTTLAPGASNGLVWFMGGTTPTHILNDGGCLLHSEPVGGPGAVINATHKILTLTNNGGSTATVNIAVITGT